MEASVHDLILREETSQRPETADGNRSDEEADIGDRHILVQTTHVLLEVAADDDNDSTGAEEEQRLEHGVGEEVEHAGHIADTSLAFHRRANAESHEHVSNL